MWRGVLAALGALKLPRKKLAMLVPYIQEVGYKNARLLAMQGYEVTAFMSLNMERDIQASAIEPAFLAECAEVLAHKDVDAVFIGCSALRCCTPGYIQELEAKTGLPVITSTQAFLWHMLREAGIEDKLDGYGELFQL
eukprot:TRINITY_DN667_c0_g1_i7.p1 TRINITY_DN667_c0_g1~~TRINITY_DN667_c0_g1_i7.p1  ORF type:complete len:138 (+),score=25.48 TRINITY_DN667_c0_g1_i7:241-654(+)